MIGKVAARGADTAGLLRYLFGPGKANEHTDPHVVAGFDDPIGLNPSSDGPGRTSNVRALAGLLDQPRCLTATPPARPVYHLVLRNALGDPLLTDQQWRRVCDDAMHATAIAPRNDPAGCRWVAVRHAPDHVHLVAILVGQDGRACWPRSDYRRVGEVCRAAEARLGLTSTAPRDGTAPPRATRAESARAQRTGRAETGRARLRREVRAVAVASRDPGDFIRRLQDAGLLVHERWSTRDPSARTGYAVALPDRVDPSPVYFAGGKLAPDLTLPKLMASWGLTGTSDSRPVGPAAVARPSADERRQMWRQAREVVEEVASRVETAAVLAEPVVDPVAARDLLAGLAWSLEGGSGGSLTTAAELLDRAAREPYGRPPEPRRDGLRLRHAARLIAASGRRGSSAGTVALVSSLVVLAEGVQALRAAQQRSAQAAAARQAADLMRGLGDRTLVDAVGLRRRRTPVASAPSRGLSPTAHARTR